LNFKKNKIPSILSIHCGSLDRLPFSTKNNIQKINNFWSSDNLNKLRKRTKTRVQEEEEEILKRQDTLSCLWRFSIARGEKKNE
jgi:guanylate kinase